MKKATSDPRPVVASKPLILLLSIVWTIALATPIRAGERLLLNGQALLKGDEQLLTELAVHDNVRCADTACWSREISARSSLGQRVRDGNARGGDCVSGLGRRTPEGCDISVMSKVDGSNLQFVMAFASAVDSPFGAGWSPPVLRDLWWLADHLGQGQDAQAIQTRWMGSFRTLVRRGVLPPLDYARIQDRLNLAQHRPQLYGTNFSCADGRGVILDSVPPKDLERNRRRLGLPPMSATLAHAKQECASE